MIQAKVMDLRFAAVLFSALLAAHAAVLPVGTELEVRLKTAVASNTSKAQQPVEAVLIRPIFAAGGMALPAGTVVRGIVKQAVPIAKPEDRAALELEFSKAAPPGEKGLKIKTRLTNVDNARESVDPSGRIVGILASETLAARIQSGVDRVGKRYSKLGDFLGGVTSAVLKEPEPEIDYAPGVELTLVLTQAAECKDIASAPAIPPAGSDSALFELVNAQPFQTTTAEQKVPSDLTNLMFAGTQEQLEAGFTAAGWASAAKLNTASGMETFRAIAEMRGYKEAPMSILLLDGRPPDLVFQKQNNTFAMRHHLRIWRRPGA
ncbi:MAG TPA: LssY C-terminal domain-containing protein, partial [Bryobacteraceae bacterium]